MKTILFLVFFLAPAWLLAQKIEGFYSGVMQNDSAHMLQKYELAISTYKGKISGYSYVTFIVNDTFYYGIRKVKGYIEGDSAIIEDDKFVSHNFPQAPAKGIYRTLTIPLKGQDSVTSLNGSWKTNQRKRYWSVPGTIAMNRSTDSAASPLIAHLKELKLIGDNGNYASTSNDKQSKPPEREADKKTGPPSVKAPSETISDIPYALRKTGQQQVIEVSGDSLFLAFYDNGVVDGDSISVYANGVPLITQVKLTTAAAKQQITFGKTNAIELLLVAENLGSIPPNTGLLTIRDGDSRYQLNFSADLQTNASILIRKKK